jgi:GNAT superfamily N-acetyltransferase
MKIRSVHRADIEATVDMGARMHAESAYSFLPYDRQKVRSLVLSFIADPDTHCGLVAEDGTTLVGMLAGHIGDYFFCDQLVAYDTIFYVEPPYRGTTAAPRLIRAFREWAVARGASELCLAISTGVNAERIGGFYARMGFQQVGATYKQRLR